MAPARVLDGMKTPHSPSRRVVLVAAMLTTVAITRTWLHIEPNTDFNIGRYNVHHLFTGILILTVCGIPAMVRRSEERADRLLIGGFGVGLALVLDEWVYLIVTDGSNAAYVQWPSLAGGVAAVVLACGYALWVSDV